MSISLYLLNRKGLRVLEYLVKNKDYASLIDNVITAKDKGNKDDCFVEISELALKNKIPLYLRTQEFQNNSTFSVAIGWRWLLKDINNLIVIHDSILPKYRGFAPLVNMLINKEEFIGATMIKANDRIDAGPILFQEKVKVEYPIKIQRAIEVVAELYVKLIKLLFDTLINNHTINFQEQREDKATYSIWRDEQDYFIDWSKSATDISRFIDSLGFPYDGAKSYLQNKDTFVKIYDAEPLESMHFEINAPGKFFKIDNGMPFILCGKGVLKIKKMRDANNQHLEFTKLRQRFL